MKNEELYDEVCKVLTWYEHPDECPFEDKFITESMYNLLVRVQNELF